KAKIKCVECPHRRFLPVTDEVVRWHLSGRDELGRDFVMGVYPMLLDETCLFLVVHIHTTVSKELDMSAPENCVCFNLRWVTRAVTQFFDAEMRRHGIRP